MSAKAPPRPESELLPQWVRNSSWIILLETPQRTAALQAPFQNRRGNCDRPLKRGDNIPAPHSSFRGCILVGAHLRRRFNRLTARGRSDFHSLSSFKRPSRRCDYLGPGCPQFHAAELARSPHAAAVTATSRLTPSGSRVVEGTQSSGTKPVPTSLCQGNRGPQAIIGSGHSSPKAGWASAENVFEESGAAWARRG